MGIIHYYGIAKHLAKRILIQRFPQQQQQRCCFSSFRKNISLCQDSLIRVPKTQHRNPLLGSFIHKSFYSSSSPSKNRKMGFLSWYLSVLDSRPIITKSISCSIIYAAADITSQMITMPPSGSLDLIRTSRMAGYGLLILGPAQHVWFNFIARRLPKRDVVTTLKKLLIGQLIFGPSVTALFYSFNAALQGETASEIGARLKRDVLPTLLNGLMFWPKISGSDKTPEPEGGRFCWASHLDAVECRLTVGEVDLIQYAGVWLILYFGNLPAME